MSGRVPFAAPSLLAHGLLVLGLWAPGCHRGAVQHAPADAPAQARVVMPTRAASAHPPTASDVVSIQDGSARVAAGAGAPTAEASPSVVPDPTAGCVASVDELPASAGLDPHDRRLRREGLLVAVKASRRLMLFSSGTLQACWRVGLGFAPTGHKEIEGDGRTPEGWYATSDKPWSSFDDAIAIHYPNAADADTAWRDGRISRRQRDLVAEASSRRELPPQRTPMGGAVLIHGGGSQSDWTLGCIALDEGDLADLRARLPRRMKTDLLVLP